MKTKLGCLSGTGLIAMVITLLLIVGVGAARGGVLFSPGELNAQRGAAPVGGVFSHADLAGNCAACHPAFWRFDDMNTRCLDCHGGILEDPQGLHAVVMDGQDRQCRVCHPEHRGAQASLTEFSSQDFPHDLVGFSLAAHRQTTAGAAFACADCHTESLARFEPVVCLNCHQEREADYMQIHLADFGPACLACHDGLESYGTNFDHDTTQFPLTGAHGAAACGACHAGAQSLVDLQATAPTCFACHAADDVHAGEFGQDCAACHTAAGWEGAQFDHSRTAFPLIGRHAETACADCHQERGYAGISTECFACHAADDAHAGAFGQDCAACHTALDWQDAQFDHSLTRFPLDGGHTDVACQDCHQEGVFAGTPTACAACHADPDYHVGLFSQACSECHSTGAWQPATYTAAHTFPMNHGEQGVSSCRVCHPSVLQSYTCYECHEHSPAKVEREHLEEGIRDFQDCMRCHPTGQEDEAEGNEGRDHD